MSTADVQLPIRAKCSPYWSLQSAAAGLYECAYERTCVSVEFKHIHLVGDIKITVWAEVHAHTVSAPGSKNTHIGACCAVVSLYVVSAELVDVQVPVWAESDSCRFCQPTGADRHECVNKRASRRVVS